MNKQLASLIACLIILPACSWMSVLNPWSGDDSAMPEEIQEAVQEQPKEVNRFLWQASLDKMSKMPLQSTDLQGGVIISDWMVVNGVPNEKFKIVVRVLGPQLRADCLKVEVFKMNRIDGEWIKTVSDPRVAAEIGKIILKQASVLYRNAVAAGEE